MSRIVISYEPPPGAPPGAEAAMTLKVKLPASWLDQPIAKVKDLFLESYAKKHAGSSLAANGVHVRSADGRALPDASVTRAFVNEHDAVTIVLGAAPERVGPPTLPPPPSTSGVATGGTGDAGAGTGLVPCRNFGCQARFQPAPAGNDASSSAAASACRHHMGPPMFRDGKKAWSCCPTRGEYEWDDFLAIPGCAVGAHTDVAPPTTFAASPTVTAAAAADAAAPAPVVKSISDFNAANPGAVTAAAVAAQTVAAAKKVMRRSEDDRVKCRHFGCAAWFRVGDAVEDASDACTHHAAAPVFHEGFKAWGCCPASRTHDFDECMAFKGCVVGKHDAGADA